MFELLPLGDKRTKRFYEAVIIAWALIQSNKGPKDVDISESASEPPSGGRNDTLHYFVDKLAQICDTHRGGRTVTSIIILQDTDGSARYVFGSNSRSTKELQDIKLYITEILQEIGDASQTSNKEKRVLVWEILHKIAEKCQPRINTYIKGLSENATLCQEAMPHDTSERGEYILKISNRLSCKENS
jgi:hypothetical protein